MGEEVWLSLTDATPLRDLDFLLLDTDPARPIWEDIGALVLEQVAATVLGDGTLLAPFFTASVEGTFDVIVDGNQDGTYRPWADVTVAIDVSSVVSVPEIGEWSGGS